MRRLSFAGRLLVGWLFVHGGWRVMRTPGPATNVSAPSLAMLRSRVPLGPVDDVAIVRANAAVHVAAGSLLMAGRAQRTAALLLAASLVPTTAAGHAFWTVSDPAQRRTQRAQFDKNVAIFGGLLVAAAAGAPTSVGSPSRLRRRRRGDRRASPDS